MREVKLSRLEMQIMEVLWNKREASIREIQDSFSAKKKPSYTTIQTTVYRMEAKKALRRTRKIGNFHVFEALVSREAAQQRLVDDLLSLFGGHTQLVMTHLVRSGKLRLEDVKEAEKELKRLQREEEAQ